MLDVKLKITPNGDVYKYNGLIFRYFDNGGAILLNKNLEIIVPRNKKEAEFFMATIDQFKSIEDKSKYSHGEETVISEEGE